MFGLYGAVQSPKSITKVCSILSQPVMLPSPSFTARVPNGFLSFLDSKAVFPVNQELVHAEGIHPHCDFQAPAVKVVGKPPVRQKG